MGNWTDFLDAAKEMNKMAEAKHEEVQSYSHIMGWSVPVCKHCRAPKGSPQWDYPCRKAPAPAPGKDDCDERIGYYGG